MTPEAQSTASTLAKDPVASLAGLLKPTVASSGVRARLRRADPRHGSRDAMFEAESLFARAGLPALDAEDHRRWFAVLHCLAIVEGRHDPRGTGAPGRVLAELRFKEARLRALVEADIDTLFDLMPRIARLLAAKARALDWGPFAALLLHAGCAVPVREQYADAARRRLVAEYVRASDSPKGEASE
jgi:hypothetical protein